MRLPPSVIAAFDWAGLPHPNPERVDARGYSATEVTVIERYRARLARAEARDEA